MRLLIILLIFASCVKQDDCTTILQTINTSVCSNGVYTVNKIRTFEVMNKVDCKTQRRYAFGDYPAEADYVFNGVVYHRDELIKCICKK